MTKITCPECGHDIDLISPFIHTDMGGSDEFWICRTEGCGCDMSPSDIARALLTSEPTEAEIEAAARVVWQQFVGESLSGFDKPTYANVREKCVDTARAALKAARGES